MNSIPVAVPVANMVASPLAELQTSELHIRQRRELAELFGFETRNKYEITTAAQTPVMYAAEQGKGILGFLARGFLGHWRTFDIVFFDAMRREVMRAHHPFRFLFPRLEISTPSRYLGAIQRRFSIFSRQFDVEGPNRQVLLTINSPFLSPWTFPFFRHGRQVAVIEKKWTGLLAEAFSDKDNFRLSFQDGSLSEDERALMLAASLLIDLVHFEQKAR